MPDTPTDLPTSDPDVTTNTQIKINFANPAPGNGGSGIVSYELQMDDGLGGDFQSIIGFDSDSLLTTYTINTGIVKGRDYRFRYRAKNLIGWGSFSPEREVLAATVPQPPG